MDPNATSVDTDDLPAREALHAWLERLFPDDVREAFGGDGYYAARNSGGPSPRSEDDDHARAQLRYYSHSLSQKRVRDKLEAVIPHLDALGARYAWYTDEYGYAYLLVERYADEPDAANTNAG